MSRYRTSQEEVQDALGLLGVYACDGNLEASTPRGRVGLAALDMGYRHHELPDWMLVLGKHFQVDVQREWAEGHDFRTASRVASRWVAAGQPPGARSDARKLTRPINPPRGIAPAVKKQQGAQPEAGNDEVVTEDKRDIKPADVFSPTPNNNGVLNLAQTGKDLADPLNELVPKDKGYDAVSNLSQYLIRTEGGGGAEPAGHK